MTTPLLSLSLLELFLQTQKLVGLAKESFFSSPDALSKEDTLVGSLKAFVETMNREVAAWPSEYAEALVTRWDAIAQDTSFYSLLLRYPPLLSVAEQAEIFFLDHVRAWASPRGDVPPVGPGKQHQRKTIQVAQRMFSRHHVEVARRLLDWPGSTAAFMEQTRLLPADWWAQQFDQSPSGPMPLAGLIHNLDAAALKVLLEQGLKLPSHEAGLPLLAAAKDNAMVALVAAHTEDLFSINRPVKQRQRDLQLLIQGWASPILEHLLRTGQDGRKEFSGASAYLQEKLQRWPSEEVEAALLPWLSSEWLHHALGRSERDPQISTWVTQLLGEDPPSPSLQRQQIQEERTKWTFEQWCLVRFLRGHGPQPMAHSQRCNIRLAKTFSVSATGARELQRTADLYKLLAWVDPQQAKEHTPAEMVPLDRLIPLLMDLMNGDSEPPAKYRDRLHELMLSLFDAPEAQQSPDMAPVLVAYTRWAWKQPKRSTNLASVGVLEWLTNPAHVGLLEPGDVHFVAVNHMISSIPFSSSLSDAIWATLEQSMNQQGHLSDYKTAFLPSPQEASGKVRTSKQYQARLRSAALEHSLPPPEARKIKPRF